MSPGARSRSLWEGLHAWLDGGGARSPSLSDWDADLAELRQVWVEAGRTEDLRGLSLLRRATRLVLLLDDAGPGSPGLAPRSGRDPRRALEAAFDGPDLEHLGRLLEGAASAPPALRARVHDLRWMLLREAPDGVLARTAYLEQARAADLDRAVEATAAGEALCRAVRLALELEDTSGLETGLSEFLPRAVHAEHPVALHRFLQSVLLLSGARRDKLADLALARAESELAHRGFRWGRVFYAHAERALAASGREEEAETVAIVRASVLGDEARHRRHYGAPEWVARSFTRRAIDEMKLVPGTEQMRDELALELGAGGAHSAAPPGVEDEGGRFATALEAVQRALDELDPVLHPRLVGSLPLEPEHAGDLPAGPQVLDQFLRRFQLRSCGRFRVEAAADRARNAAIDGARVAAWLESTRGWLTPLLDGLRRADPATPVARRATLRRHFVDAGPVFASAAGALAQGAAACWEGDAVGGLRSLVGELARLRGSAPVRHLLERSGSLALVDAALLDHPEGLGLTALADESVPARGRAGQEAANLAVWWTLCLASLAADASAGP